LSCSGTPHSRRNTEAVIQYADVTCELIVSTLFLAISAQKCRRNFAAVHTMRVRRAGSRAWVDLEGTGMISSTVRPSSRPAPKAPVGQKAAACLITCDAASERSGWRRLMGGPVEEIMPVSFEIKHKRVIRAAHSSSLCTAAKFARQFLGQGDGQEKRRYDQLAGLHRRTGLRLRGWRRELGSAAATQHQQAAVKNKIDKMTTATCRTFRPCSIWLFENSPKSRFGCGPEARHRSQRRRSTKRHDKLLRDYANAKITIAPSVSAGERTFSSRQ